MIRRTKIVATLGPASSTPERIRALLEAGLDVARINFSHGDHETHAHTIARVREMATALGRPVAILGDLQGPKIRLGKLEGPVTLAVGDLVTFAPEGEHRPGELPITYHGLAQDLSEGDVVLLADGLLEMLAVEVAPPRIHLRVIHGGTLSSNKGINLPGAKLSIPSLTDKDLADLEFALEQEVDYLALSFVREPEDVRDLVRRVPVGGPLVVVKVEKGHALLQLPEILSSSAAAMVARGDLGVEIPFEQVPLAQKRMIQLANSLGRPVITATQMLESMITNPRPTRAEASDVANAILDGTDAVMLSAETASGQFPVEAVKTMVRIITEIESSGLLSRGPSYDLPDMSTQPGEFASTERAIASATMEAVRRLGSPLIITLTTSGFTARVVSSLRPPVPILAVTDSPRTCRQLALVWGVIPTLCSPELSEQEMLEFARERALALGLASPGSRVVVTAGLPVHMAGTTNMLQVITL